MVHDFDGFKKLGDKGAKDDAASKIKKLEEDLTQSNEEIDKLKKIIKDLEDEKTKAARPGDSTGGKPE